MKEATDKRILLDQEDEETCLQMLQFLICDKLDLTAENVVSCLFLANQYGTIFLI
jgi:hypothetical protein